MLNLVIYVYPRPLPARRDPRHLDILDSGHGVKNTRIHRKAHTCMELVCACVNLKLRPSPLAWVAIDSKKTGCWIDPRTEAATPQSVPRSLAWGGRKDDVTGSDIAARPEVNEKHTVLRSKSCFFCLMKSREGAGYKRDVCDGLVTSRPEN